VWKDLFSKKSKPLSGSPPVRRMKTYSAQSGYVYQYFYEGHRPYGSGEDGGVEFVFSVSADRKSWHAAGVFVAEAVLHAWEAAHARQLSSTERYAIAKLALFQAFDERATPALMREDVRVRAADVDAIVETLDL
jgi:hypothetical protein